MRPVVTRQAPPVAGTGAVREVMVEKRKPCGRVRRRWRATPLGADEWGDWFDVPDDGGVLLLPVADPWAAWFRADGSVRVDVATAVVVADPVSSFVDLDLDVERTAGGTVHALDLEDFLERSPGYPRAWCDLAWAAWHEVERDVAARAEPFGVACDPWLRLAPSLAPGAPQSSRSLSSRSSAPSSSRSLSSRSFVTFPDCVSTR